VTTVIYLPFVLSIVLVGLSRSVCRRTSPRAAAWSVTAAMVLLAASTVGALVLLAWPLAARLPVIAREGGWHPSAVNHVVPVPVPVSILAAVILVVLAGLVIDQALRIRDGVVEVSRMHTELAPAGGAAVAVVQDSRPSAHALPGTLAHRGRVVVSTGLLDALDDEERAAVLAHEHAHLAHAHRLFVVVAALAAALDPVVWWCRHDVEFALERWADEDAASRTGRAVTARALARAALAKLSSVHQMPAPARATALGLARLGVAHRVAALLEPEQQQRRTALAWLVAILALVGIAAILWATRDTERLFELLQAH
jgi:hypothetical protein